jgi:lysophospholipase L1-like esterase
MKTVLCFGDSNTWGYDPDASFGTPFPRRHPRQIRWTGVLAAELGAEWYVIEEGQNGRTTVHDDPFAPARNGLAYLPACLESQQPLDVVVLMLGTNDLKAVHAAPVGEIATGAGILARMILQSTAGPRNAAPKLLLVAPPAVGSLEQDADRGEKLASAEAKARRFPALYRALAAQLGAAFLDSQAHTTPSPIDGVHLDAASHAALGRAVAASVQKLVEG